MIRLKLGIVVSYLLCSTYIFAYTDQLEISTSNSVPEWCPLALKEASETVKEKTGRDPELSILNDCYNISNYEGEARITYRDGYSFLLSFYDDGRGYKLFKIVQEYLPQ